MTATLRQAEADALEAIRHKAGGLLRAEDVVKAARRVSHPLHGRFQWDDTEAARLFRLEQARGIIRAVVTLIPRPGADAEPVRVRAYVSVPSRRAEGGGYLPVAEVMADKDMAEEAGRELMAELDRLRLKFAAWAHLSPYLTALEGVRDLVGKAADRRAGSDAEVRP